MNSTLSTMLSNIERELEKIEHDLGFFDIETRNLFSDVYPAWEKLTWSKRNELQSQVTPRLKVAIAGILTFDREKKKLVYNYYLEDEINHLVRQLDELDVIVGHNLFRFDYPVMEAYLSASPISNFKKKTVDLFKILQEITDKYIGLDDLGKLNLGLSKTLDSKKIPGMWREGKHVEVKKYLKRDLELLAGIYCHGLIHEKLIYPYKEYGKFVENREVKVTW